MVVERIIEYLKDRTEAFDDYFPCIRNGLCSMQHVYKWLILFVFMHNNRISSNPILILLKEVKGVKLAEPASSKDYGYSICDRIFDSIETLNSHKRMDHSQEGYQRPAGVGRLCLVSTLEQNVIVCLT